MLRTKGHIGKYHVPCCIIYEDFKKRNGVKATFEEFIKSIESFTGKYSEDVVQTYKGDMLEIFSEIFFKAFENDARFGLKNYEPVKLENDFGVDATGVNVNGHKCAIQVKFRSNPFDDILYSDIAKTYCSGRRQLGLNLDEDNSIFIFTSAHKVTVACNNVMQSTIRLISREVISTEVDNNKSFWEFAYSEIEKTLFNKEVKKVESKVEEVKKEEVKENMRERRPSLDFIKIGLKVGDEIVFEDNETKATIKDNKKVLYKNVEYSLTRLSMNLLKIEHYIQPTGRWTFKGTKLIDLYNKIY
jgi:hypothetical protein